MKIKVKLFNKLNPIEINKNGDWIDLKAAETVSLNGLEATTLKRPMKDGVRDTFREVKNNYYLLPLGVAIQLPKGYEAVVVSRSSIFKNYKCIMANSFGVIDNIYCGDNDQWYAPIIPFENTTIFEGDRICQFRVQLSQKATRWQKIKWLFSSGITIQYVDKLNNKNRGGIGSSGIK